MCMYLHTHIITTKEKEHMNFKGKKGRVHRMVCREKMESENLIIIISKTTSKPIYKTVQ